MIINFLRFTKVIIGDKELNSDDYNIQFKVNRSLSSDANDAEIKFTYINEDTVSLFEKGKEIKIMAGYKKGIIGLIFSGTIDEVIEEEINDILIIATEGNEVLRNKIINQSFSPGTKASLIVRKIIQEAELTPGSINIPNEINYLRGKNFTENVKDSLDKIASENNCIWYEKKGMIYFHPENYSPGKTFINANSGLLQFNKTTDGYTLITKLNSTLEENNIVEVEYNIDKKINVIIESVSHYSDDFTTHCEVSNYE
ncbi:MAG: hypothetical protein RR795_01380 [Cetobacterium sp.]|uniref:hypothetical protein n=1 Tax=Cetobacterium sp. TaxID=2071632 RepID=UPI002FC97E68